MPFRVEWQRAAERDVRKLPADVAGRVAAAVEHFAATASGDVRKLSGVKPPVYRLRSGDWRILFDWDQAAGVISVLRVVNRRDAY